jgi:hypothetical protein
MRSSTNSWSGIGTVNIFTISQSGCTPYVRLLSSREAMSMHNGQVIWPTPRSKGLCASPHPASLLSDEIIDLWLPYAEDPDESCRAHQDINEVMLATAIAPSKFLSIRERIP